MLPQVIAGLLAMAALAGQSAAPPPTPPSQEQVDLHGIAQALGSIKKVPAPNKCGESSGAQARRGIVSVLGSVGGFLVPGVGGAVAAVALPAASYLSDKLLTMLDCKEQQQAARATEQAIRGGVGTEISWKSETRPNVTGRTKVVAQQKLSDGSGCLTVTDVVIVDGEETTVPKRMCRAKGASGYVRT